MYDGSSDPLNVDSSDVADRGWLRRMVGWRGLVLCVFPAVVLAACSLSADDGGPPDTERSSTAGTAPSAAEPGTTAAATDPPSPSTDTPPAATDGEAAAGAVSFANDVEPIITRTCANCHTGEGPGTQHVVMDTADFVARASAGISLVVETGFMPPWPASDESVAFDHDWSLRADEIATLLEWDAAGSPLDVPAEHPIEPQPDATARLTDPDIGILSEGSYDGTLGQPDEYRCFIYDPDIDGPGFVTSLDFQPDQEQVVHHAVGFLVSAADRAALDEVSGADGQGGWTCFGFQPGRSAQLVYAWAPGQAATRYDDGSGLWMDDGDFFVVQTHYHFDVEAPADQSTLAIDVVPASDPAAADMVAVDVQTYLAPAEIPCTSEETGPLCDRDAAVALAVERYGVGGFLADGILGACGQSPEDFAGMTDGIATASCDLPVQGEGEIVSVFGHEHELGATFRMTLNPDTPDEVVLLDIPRWDFDWQLLYEPAESIVLQRGDTVRVECSWDRSLRDPELEPAYVIWADGTDDEMCFATITTRP